MRLKVAEDALCLYLIRGQIRSEEISACRAGLLVGVRASCSSCVYGNSETICGFASGRTALAAVRQYLASRPTDAMAAVGASVPAGEHVERLPNFNSALG